MNTLLEALKRVEEQNAILLERQNESAWLTDELVAERFKVSKQTVYRWIKAEKNRMPFCQNGEVRRYYPKEVDEWFMGFSEKGILKVMNHKKAA
jgi:excisionase family DNA binding protein